MLRVIFVVGLLLLICGHGEVVASDQIGRVVGRVDCSSLPSCSGVAALWSVDGAIPDPRKYTRIPGPVAQVQSDGVFELSGPAGDYYVGVFLRNSPGPLMGPPRVGDLIFLTPNPAGEPSRVTLKAGETTDAGVHDKAWVFAGLTDPSATAISGQVVDIDGRPVAGLLVFAFSDREVSASPLSVSERTEADGSFFLPLAEAGSVYLRTRKDYQGGRPEPGDYVGVFGGTVPAALVVAEGVTISDMKIVARKLPSLLQMQNAPVNSRPKIELR
ncbi:MAG TPA: carboxypeptidase-like regulatory domain-containing protein [Malonomonas sp.]